MSGKMASSPVIPIAEADICLFQGATFSQTLIWEMGNPPVPVNLTGYSAKLQVRSSHKSKAVIIELSTDNSRISLGTGGDMTTGAINLFISAAHTGELSVCEEVKAVYDLEMTSGYTVSRILQGNVIIVPEVTK
jgi:hypothetical protein